MLQTTELAPPVQGVRAGVSSGWAGKQSRAAHSVIRLKKSIGKLGLRSREMIILF